MSQDKRGETFVMTEPPQQGEVSFTAFILGLATSAFIHLGERPDPESGKTEVNLPLAKQSLDLLLMLRAKTNGNLSQEEERLFVSLLTDLELRFVQAAKKK